MASGVRQLSLGVEAKSFGFEVKSLAREAFCLGALSALPRAPVKKPGGRG